MRQVIILSAAALVLSGCEIFLTLPPLMVP